MCARMAISHLSLSMWTPKGETYKLSCSGTSVDFTPHDLFIKIYNSSDPYLNFQLFSNVGTFAFLFVTRTNEFMPLIVSALCSSSSFSGQNRAVFINKLLGLRTNVCYMEKSAFHRLTSFHCIQKHNWVLGFSQCEIIWNPHHLAKWQELVIIAKYC